MSLFRRFADRELIAENELLRERIVSLKELTSATVADAHYCIQHSRHNWRTSVIVEAEKIAEQFIRLNQLRGTKQ